MMIFRDHSFIVLAIVLLFMVAFCATLFMMLQKTAKEDRVFPIWFVWFFLVPVVGFIFQWMMLPFGIPNTLKNAMKKNQEAIRAANRLFYVGLLQVLFPTIGLFVHHDAFTGVIALCGITCWIIYWVMAALFSKTYLSAPRG